MSLNVVTVSLGRLYSKRGSICDKHDLQFSEDMEKKVISYSSSLYSQLSQQVLAVAANRVLTHMNKQSDQLWQIFSAYLKALSPDFALVFLWLCYGTYINP